MSLSRPTNLKTNIILPKFTFRFISSLLFEMSSFISNGKEFNHKALNDIYVINILGQGCFGSVYGVWSTTLEKVLALKVLTKYKKVTPSSNDDLFTERNALVKITELKIPFTTHLLEAFQSNDNAFFLTEIYKFGNLESFLEYHGPVPEPVAKQVISQILYALGELHSNGIYHGDINPRNILIDDNGVATICDFGLASFNPILTSLHRKTSSASTIRLKNFSQSPLFEELDDLMCISEVIKSLVFGIEGSETKRKISNTCEELIELLSKDFDNLSIRNVAEVKSHAWFGDVFWNDIKETNYVLQKPLLYNLIVRDNLLGGKPSSIVVKGIKHFYSDQYKLPLTSATTFFQVDEIDEGNYLTGFDYINSKCGIAL